MHALVSCCEKHRKVYVQNGIKWATKLTELKMFNKHAVIVWRECCCPISGFVYEEYVRCKRKYKKAVKEAIHTSKRATANRRFDA